MFDVPADAWYVWLGVAAASLVALGAVLAFPTGTPPDAVGAADAIDRVAVSPPGAGAVHELDAAESRVGPHRIQLRNDAGGSAATLAYGPITPVGADARLAAVLDGDRPSEVFASPSAFERAQQSARETDRSWQSAPDRLVIRRVTWEGVDATLVG